MGGGRLVEVLCFFIGAGSISIDLLAGYFFIEWIESMHMNEIQYWSID